MKFLKFKNIAGANKYAKFMSKQNNIDVIQRNNRIVLCLKIRGLGDFRFGTETGEKQELIYFFSG